jgi:hypothetical protein
MSGRKAPVLEPRASSLKRMQELLKSIYGFTINPIETFISKDPSCKTN